MKTTRAVFIVSVIFLIPLFSVTARAEPEASAVPVASVLRKDVAPWSRKMQDMYRTLAELLTDVSSESRFFNPAHRVRIEQQAAKIAGFAHDLKSPGMTQVDADPTVRFLADALGRETKRAVLELKKGHMGAARSILRSVPGYCIACHTRNASGPQFSEFAMEPRSTTMSAVERGEFFAASRQFDRAQAEFIRVIRDPKLAQAYGLEWEKAVYHALSIAVRVKQDPGQANEIVDALLAKSTQARHAVKEDAKAWKTSIQSWIDEGPRRANTDEGLYAEALRLMSKAREIQAYPMDRTADILYLRASAAAHDLLQIPPPGRHVAEGLLLAGLSYEVLGPYRLEDLHDVYYEACIRRAPHTITAEVCYRRYEQSQFLSLGGNTSGAGLSAEDRSKLVELKNLAETKSTGP